MRCTFTAASRAATAGKGQKEGTALPEGSSTAVSSTGSARQETTATAPGKGRGLGAGARAGTQRLSQRIKGGRRAAAGLGWTPLSGGFVAAVGSAGKAPAGRGRRDGDGQAATAVRRRGTADCGPAGAARGRAARGRGGRVRGEAVRPRVHPRRHLHLRRLPLEAALPAGRGARARGR